MPLNKDDGVVWIQFGQIFSARVLHNYIAKCHVNYRFVSDAPLFPHPLKFLKPQGHFEGGQMEIKIQLLCRASGVFSMDVSGEQ